MNALTNPNALYTLFGMKSHPTLYTRSAGMSGGFALSTQPVAATS